MAEQQTHEQELTNVRQAYVAQQAPVPVESEPVIEAKKASTHTSTPTSTPLVTSKAKAMPPEPSKLALPPPDSTTSSSSIKHVPPQKERTGTTKETNESKRLPRRGRASTVEEQIL